MTRLRSDCLVFEQAGGGQIILPGALLARELFEAPDQPHAREALDHAASAVVYFFKKELGRQTVTVGEFTLALERVLAEMGLPLKSPGVTPAVTPPAVTDSDLRHLAVQCGKGYELIFFSLLRAEMRRLLKDAPKLVQVQGLRACVKQLLGVRRWTQACQVLSDEISDYLRFCLVTESKAPCALMVR